MSSSWTIEETASTLNITEQTLKAFVEAEVLSAQAGEPDPGFDPEIVEKFKKSLIKAHKNTGISDRTFSIEENLQSERLLFSDLPSQKALFSFLAGQAVKSGLAKSESDIEDELWKREALMSTGIGLGIAVPHLRLEQLSSVELFLLLNKNPIQDYDTMDGRPVEMIVFILVGRHMHKEYLKTLASVINLLKKDEIRKAVLACTDTSSAHTIITGKF